MESLQESLFDNDLASKDPYKYHPKVQYELREAIEIELKEQGPDANLNIIDVSDIKDMSYLFADIDIGNIDISKWDVGECERYERYVRDV